MPIFCTIPISSLSTYLLNHNINCLEKLGDFGHSAMNRKGTKEETSDEPSTHLLHSSSLAQQIQEILKGYLISE